MTSFVQTVDDIFSESGALSKLKEFEYRPQQRQMAVAVAEALESGRHLIVEAPTGVGKSLAYLIPAVLYARKEKRKAVISTHTKNLQEQLFRKDITIVRGVLGEKEVHAVVLKGRRNYLCTTRLARSMASTGSLFNDGEQDQLRRIFEWSHETPDGDMENLGFTPAPNVWDMVCSEKGICSSTVCGFTCFFQRTKEKVRAANLVIINHALFFTLMALQESEEGFIFPNDFVIFDEAHTLEAVAGIGIGKNISRYQILSTIHKLWNSKTKRGLFAKQKKAIRALCEETEEKVLEFFETIRTAAQTLMESSSPSNDVRIRRPYFIQDSLTAGLVHLEKEAEKIQSTLKHEFERNEVTAARRALWEAQVLVGEFLEQPKFDFTYWVELGTGRSGNVTLCASPSNIADAIGPKLFRNDTSVVMTSATLAVNNSLDYFQRRIGGVGVGSLILDSPFSHHTQMKLFIARDIPEPDAEGFANALPQWIMRSVDRSGGKALVLFTSTVLMRTTAKQLAGEFDDRGIKLLVQGIDRQRHDLLQEFKRDVHSVLFGLDSFWQGVDVPGEALEHVIITRLPFAAPNHPLIEAKLEEIARRAGNSFMEYTLPEAVLKFRQGFGRLLRSTSDRGMVTILDSRVLKKRYGSVFLSSIPKCPVEILIHNGESAFFQDNEW
ncbi:MAG: DEAD/DEAH box helicase [Bacteroidetes bacterium]|nr:DEAD/DEAH box helicase [Bacteroidota bacterium]MCW5895575.1 DEAD/DEAH box helicase [Bacteroidota bacterium]